MLYCIPNRVKLSGNCYPNSILLKILSSEVIVTVTPPPKGDKARKEAGRGDGRAGGRARGRGTEVITMHTNVEMFALYSFKASILMGNCNYL